MYMRDIKFRGKRIDNGEWVIGDLLRIGGVAIIYTGRTTNIDILKTESDVVAIELKKEDVAVVHLDSVGQYTGFKDKEGNEIYEGDILDDGYGSFGKVWVDSGEWCICYLEESLSLFDYNKFGNDVKVIGSFFDNPDFFDLEKLE